MALEGMLETTIEAELEIIASSLAFNTSTSKTLNRLELLIENGRLTRNNVEKLMGKLVERAGGHLEAAPLLKLLHRAEVASLHSEVCIILQRQLQIACARARVNAHAYKNLHRLCMRRHCVSSCEPKTSNQPT
jgi:hypothetical protein